MNKMHLLPIRITGWTFRIVSAAVLGIVVLCAGWEYTGKVVLRWNNVACIGAGLVGAALLLLLARALSGHIRRKRTRYLWIGILSLLAGCAAFYCGSHYAMTPGWDVGLMCQNAQVMYYEEVDELMDSYFSTYPNNILLTWIQSKSFAFAELLGVPAGQYYFVGLAIQSLGFGLSAFLVYVCADKLTGESCPDVPLWCWFIALIMVCSSPWVVVMYSDSASLILVMIELWLYLKAREKSRFTALWAGLLVFTGVIAYHIKPQGSIILIAAMLMTLFTEGVHLFQKDRLRRTGVIALSCILGASLALGSYSMVVNDTGFEIDPDRSFGPAHFLMMGLNTETTGTYLESDVGFSASFSNQLDRTKGDLERAGKRIQAMGLGGLLEHAVKKTLVNYSDGTFSWENEGNFYAYDTYYSPWASEWGYNHIPNFYIGEEYTNMVEWSCSWIFRLIEQSAWMMVLMLGIFAFSKQTNTETSTIMLTLLGMTLFGLLFECRARYVFAYVPVYILAAGIGLKHVKELFAEKKGLLQKDKKLKS